MPTFVLADVPLLPPQGKITGINYGQKAPYTGVLLNTIAAAKLLTNKDYSEKQWELRLKYELAKQAANLNLVIETQKASHLSLQERHSVIMGFKDTEIERLSGIAANQSDYSHWWASGGVVVGILLTIGVVYAVNNVD